MLMEPHVKLIKALPVWDDPVSINALNGGITNFNYLVTSREKKYVARFAPEANALLGLRRQREVINTRIAASLGLGPKVVKFYPEHRLLIPEYIEGALFTPEKGRQLANIKRLARLFKKLHRGPKFVGHCDPFSVVGEYVAAARARGGWVPPNIDRSLEKLKVVKAAVAPLRLTSPCHLDVMIGNIVDAGKDVKLIDWEYSANSDPRFDLAMFSVKANFTPRHDAILLRTYGLKLSKAEFDGMKAAVYFREGAWGLLQLAISEIPFNFKKYAVENIASFNRIADQLSG